jgi:hypothetical protein
MSGLKTLVSILALVVTFGLGNIVGGIESAPLPGTHYAGILYGYIDGQPTGTLVLGFASSKAECERGVKAEISSLTASIPPSGAIAGACAVVPAAPPSVPGTFTPPVQHDKNSTSL